MNICVNSHSITHIKKHIGGNKYIQLLFVNQRLRKRKHLLPFNLRVQQTNFCRTVGLVFRREYREPVKRCYLRTPLSEDADPPVVLFKGLDPSGLPIKASLVF